MSLRCISRWVDRQSETSLFWLVFICSTIPRIVLAFFPHISTTYTDELIYLELAQNFWREGTLSVYHIPLKFSKLLYPLIISPFTILQDSAVRMTAISVFNALLVSSALIPGYLLARNILKKKSHLLLSLIILALSPNMLFSLTFMSENLYLPLLLWGFWLIYRFLSADTQHQINPVRGLAIGVFCFALYLVKEAGAAFIAATGITVSVLAILHRNKRKQHFLSLVWILAGFLVPFLLVRLIVFSGAAYSYSGQINLSNLFSASKMLFVLYSVLCIGLLCLMSVLFFPVIIPLLEQKHMKPEHRRLLLFSTLYLLFVVCGAAFAVSLDENYGSSSIRISLRYLVSAFYPFLLLFFIAAQKPYDMKRKKTLLLRSGCMAFASLILFVLPPVHFGSLLDSPTYHMVLVLSPFFSRTETVLRLLISLYVLLSGLFLYTGRRNAFIILVTTALLCYSAVNDGMFVRHLLKAAAPPSSISKQEAAAVDQWLDTADGNVLVVRDYWMDKEARFFDCYTNDDYDVITTDNLRAAAFSDENNGIIRTDRTALTSPVDFLAANQHEKQPFPVNYIIVQDADLILSDQYHEDITPEGIHFVRIYRSVSPDQIHIGGLIQPDNTNDH